MLLASESKAASEAGWRSCEKTPSGDGPFGKPPPPERERSCISGGCLGLWRWCFFFASAAGERIRKAAMREARIRIVAVTPSSPQSPEAERLCRRADSGLVSGLDLLRALEPEPAAAGGGVLARER